MFSSLLVKLVATLIGGSLCGAAYAAAAWHVARKWGERSLIVMCLAATLLVWAVVVKAGAPSHGLPHFRLFAFTSVLGGFVLATISVRERRRQSATLTIRIIAAGIGAYFGGQLIGLLPMIVREVVMMLRPLLT